MSNLKRVTYSDERRGKEINLKDYLDVFKGRFWILIIMMLLGGGAAYGYSYMNNTPIYESSTRMILGGEDENMNTLMVMIKDPIIMEKVRGDLNLPQSAEGLANQIEVSQLDDSEVVQVAVTANDPQMAADIADKTAAVYKSEIVNILEFKQVQILSQAKVNPFPTNEFQDRNIVIATIAGLVLGVGIIFLLDTLDGTVKSREELEDFLGIPVIGTISPMNKKNSTTRGQKRKTEDAEVRSESVEIK
ncbi:capsular biosynthesis protein [Halobacillus sp. A1]|uniref:YveK family protein n=1 Tax=Halobacillus sp. A1 TaxID=2880262 RepID=UPI0020A67EF7|nr:Wzz/FepE/Etk N-terminal domain-containing protein [Halobacillus sp. A1]MCP3030039.1 capsular biosynthesis protein [Halobacillus sp. A1]